MSTTIVPTTKSQQTSEPGKARFNLGEVLAWTALGGLLVVALPLFLCMGLWADVAYYGIFAQAISQGGILERDVMVYFQPPTMGWILLVIQWLSGGWHSEAIRFADFLFVSAAVWLMVNWLKPMGVSRVGRIWTAVVLFTFYFSTSEWCHCQPDTWMLVPALGALYLRHRQIGNLLRPQISPAAVGAWATLEGFLWASACMFKPFVILPGAICWLIAVAFGYSRSRRFGKLAIDALGMVVGGLLVGGIWILWLKLGGGWPYFWEDVRGWSGHYYQTSPEYSERILYLFAHFRPWGLVHLVAIPVALVAIYRLLTWSPPLLRTAGSKPNLTREALLGGFFLGFCFQGNFVQRQYDYQIVPGLLLGIAFMAGQSWIQVGIRRGPGGRRVVVHCPLGGARLRPSFVAVVVGVILTVAVVRHPLHSVGRLTLWPRCWREGGSPELKDRLALDISYYPSGQFFAHWRALSQVAAYLRAQGVHEGEVTCFGMHTIHLYLDLDIAPSTRFPCLDAGLRMFPEKQLFFQDLLNASKHRFAVSDLHDFVPDLDDKAPDELGQTKLAVIRELDPYRNQGIFPWAEPVVFRAGPYLVHRVTGPVKLGN